MADVEVKNINLQPVATPSYYVAVDADGKAIRANPVAVPVQSVIGLTGAITQGDLRSALGLGGAAYLSTGTTGTTVALGNHTHTPASLGAEPTISAGTTSQYYRGDKTWSTFPSFQVPVQYKNAGTNIGSSGAIGVINFTGNSVAASVVGTTLTVDINASSGGGGTVTNVSATAPTDGFTISVSNPTTTPNLTFTLADDLAAVEGISTTGWVKRTAADTWSTASSISLISDVSGVLPKANGGTGTDNPSLVAGTNVTITGTWPNQTITATSSGGGGNMYKITYDPNDDGKIDYAQTSGFGTASPLNVAASGNASATEIVKGDDTRLSDARTPTAHNQLASTISDSTATGRALLTTTDATSARTTLGLGTAALSATTDFAPASLSTTVSGHTTQLSELYPERELIIAVSDESTALVAGTNKITIRAPFNMTLTKIPRASVGTASTSGLVTVDINVGGTSILGANKLSIDATEKTSTTAATATTLATTSVTDDAEITIDLDAAGAGAKGLKVCLYYKRAS